MKNFIRPITFVLTIVLMLSLMGTSFAQQDECFNLSAEDCDLYYQFSTSGEMPLSSAFGLDIAFAGSMEEAGTSQDLEMALFFDGAYVVDSEAIDTAVAEFSDTPLLDVSARTFLDLMRGTVSGVDVELAVDYEFPPELGVPPLGPIQLWLVDGIGYMDLTPFAAFDPSLEGVYGVNLFDLIEVPLEQVRMGDILALFDGMDMGGMGMSSDPEATNALAGLGTTNPFANFMPDIKPEDIMSAITLERADDSSVDGHDVAVFVTTVDLSALMQVEGISSIAYQSAAQSGMPDSISETDFAEALAQAFDGTIVVTEKFDLETGTGLQTIVVGDFNIDAAPFAALTGEQTDGTIAMTFTWDFALSNVNNVDAIEAPEDAQIIPVEALLGGM